MTEYKVECLEDKKLEKALKNVAGEERGLLKFFINHDLPIQEFEDRNDLADNLDKYYRQFIKRYSEIYTKIVPSVELTVKDDKIGYYKDGSFNALAYMREVKESN